LNGNDEICIQGHLYEATNFKMAANKIVLIFIEIGVHWQFDDCIGSHFENDGLVKMTLNANCIIRKIVNGLRFQ
jgi:hypothetical protein